MSEALFEYVSVMRTTPQALWTALTEPTSTLAWWGVSIASEWRTGSPMDFTMRGVTICDEEQRVLVAEPHSTLSYTWHTFSEPWAHAHGFSEQMRLSFAGEPRSRVEFDLGEMGENVRLTVRHYCAGPTSVVLAAVRQGWPQLVSSLKTLVETGQPLNF